MALHHGASVTNTFPLQRAQAAQVRDYFSAHRSQAIINP
jgi:hypothetical protein